MGASKHTGMHPNKWRHPNILGVSKHMGASKHTGGCPNIGGCPHIQQNANIQVGIQTYGSIQTYGVSKHTGGIQMYGGHMDTPSSLTKHAFFLLYMYSRHPNIHRGIKHMGVSRQGASKHRGVQAYRGYPNILGASKHTGVMQTYWGIQTYRGCIQIYVASKYRGCPNIGSVHTGRHSNIGGVQTYGGIKTYRRVSKHIGAFKHTGGYPNKWGHPNIPQAYRGHPNIWGVSIHTGGVQTYGSIHTYRGHPNIWGEPAKRVLPLINVRLPTSHCQLEQHSYYNFHGWKSCIITNILSSSSLKIFL